MVKKSKKSVRWKFSHLGTFKIHSSLKDWQSMKRGHPCTADSCILTSLHDSFSYSCTCNLILVINPFNHSRILHHLSHTLYQSRIKVPQLYAPFLRLTLFYKGCTQRSARCNPDPHKVDRGAQLGEAVNKLTGFEHVTASWAWSREAA